ncbi:MAG: NAD(P)-dependent oxidoreductase [Actinomycetota bacterium]|nr:NAD(P)-dependent oxidoreductase [Actinomycetota bacterium]
MSELTFLGTGTMGLPMARNLLTAGFDLRVWNRTADRAAPLLQAGARRCEDPAAAAQGAAIVVTMLSDAEAVLEIAGLALPTLTQGATWIQMSTIGIEGTERCAELAHNAGVTFVDAPVLGTKAPAEQGQLVILASGPESAQSLCEPIFASVGARTVWLGGAGAGARVKVVVNGWIVGVVAVLAETINVAEALGVDPQLFFAAIEGGPLDLAYARAKGSAMMSRSFEDPSFRLALSRKDADLLLSAVADADLELPVMQAVLARLHTAERAGHGDEDMAATYWVGVPESERPGGVT